MTTLIFCDVETGGLDPRNDALLQVAMVHWRDGEILGTFSLDVHPVQLRVTDEALAVNKIDLEAHKQKALYRGEAALKVTAYLKERVTTDGKVMLAGHNTRFDIGFVRYLLEGWRAVSEGEAWHDLIYHRAVDTMAILPFLRHAGLIDLESGSLEKALAYFGIPNEAPHTALGDATATAHLYTHLLALVSGEYACKALFGKD